MDKHDIFLTKNGDTLSLENGRFYLTDPVPGEDIMIDGAGVGDVGNIVLRDREVLSDDGIFIAAVTIDRKKKKIISKPLVSTRGFVYIKANHTLMNGAVAVIQEAIKNNFENKRFDWTELKQDVRNSVEKYLYKETGRRPVVLPVVMEVNQNRHRAMAKKNKQENATPNKKNNKLNRKKTSKHKTTQSNNQKKVNA